MPTREGGGSRRRSKENKIFSLWKDDDVDGRFTDTRGANWI